MKMFLDSAKTDEIKRAIELWNIDGVTTNPRHVKASGKPFRTVIEEIAELFSGTDKPISVEVDPNLTDWEQIVAQGVELASISPNFVIKVGVGGAGCKAMGELAAQGVRVNATLIFSTAQAWHAARRRAAYVSPFLGWREQHGDSALELVPEIKTMLENFDYQTQIIAAAVRNARQIADAAIAGADCITASVGVFEDSFNNPYTNMGEEIFRQAWNETPTE